MLLIAGLARTGLLRPIEGRGAAQALGLIAASGIGALAIASPLGATLAVVVGLLAVRHGPVGGEAA